MFKQSDESRGAQDGHATSQGYPAEEPSARRSTAGEALLDESGQPFASYFSGNTVQICPVGALTGAAYRFRSRPFDLVSTPSVCEHCASGCALRIDHRRGVVLRRLAADDPAVNEEWNCDKGRWAFTWQTASDRLSTPLIRERNADGSRGELRTASWPEALEFAAAGLRAAQAKGVGVLAGGRVTVEDAYGYAKFARMALGTNDVDFRARPHSAEEEAEFLAAAVAGRGIGGHATPTSRLAPTVLLAGLEAEEESPIVFLRLRKAVAARGTRVISIAAWASRGLEKLGGRAVLAAPGTETEVLDAIAAGQAEQVSDVTDALRDPGAVILVGDRLAATPGALTAVLSVAEATGARLAWVPRRAGERGAVEAGPLPGLLPGGRPVADAAARVDVAAAWGVDSLPATPGRDTAGILAAAAFDGTRRPGGRRRRPLPTCPTRPRPGSRWTRSTSWSAWRCGPVRWRSGRTWSSRSRRRPRRPAPSWTGRAAGGPSRPR